MMDSADCKPRIMNYIVQQKHYNNRLTERSLEVATNHNYVYDENDFNVVAVMNCLIAVMDCLQCYYISYVPSSKKIGIVVEYSVQQQVQQNPKKRKLSSEINYKPEHPNEEINGVGAGHIEMQELLK